MTQAQIIKRIEALERQLTDVQQKINATSHDISGKNGREDWRAMAGVFANDPLFEQAMRYGREYRESLKPKRGKRRAKRS